MTRFGNDLIAAMREAVAHARGESTSAIVHRVKVGDIDVKSIRKRAGLKQHQMAPLLGVSLSGYRKWEQRKRAVSGPARALLTVLEREPEAVLRALFGSSPERENASAPPGDKRISNARHVSAKRPPRVAASS